MGVKITHNKLTGVHRFPLLLLLLLSFICQPISAQFLGGNGDGFAFGSLGNFGEKTLPITLTMFDLKDGVDSVKLVWETATEINNNYYTIERSINGVDWYIVNTIKGQGNSNCKHFYEAYDKNPFNGLSYYHLKQTDYDGKCIFSKMESIVREIATVGLSVFPNPAHNILALHINEDLGTVPVIINNMYGKLVWSSVLNTSLKEGRMIDISDLKAGWYFIQIQTFTSKNNSFSSPFMKVD